MKTTLAWIRTIFTEVPAIVFVGFRKAEKARLERAAEQVRAVAAKFGPNSRPLILNEPEACPACNRDRMIFVWPYKSCDDCWKLILNHFLFDVPFISQLSFWSERVNFAEFYSDGGEFPSEQALTINLKKLGPEDRRKLSEIENPVEAVERQIYLLFASKNLADKLEVRREKDIVHICPISSIAQSEGAFLYGDASSHYHAGPVSINRSRTANAFNR